MGKPHNWEETDNLLEKLRAKINEDTSEPAPPAPEPEAAEKTPDRTPEPNANIPLAGRKRRKNRTRVQPPETDGTDGDGAKNAEKEQEAVTAQKPAPAPVAPISKPEPPAPESAAPTTQSAPPAPSQPAPVAGRRAYRGGRSGKPDGGKPGEGYFRCGKSRGRRTARYGGARKGTRGRGRGRNARFRSAGTALGEKRGTGRAYGSRERRGFRCGRGACHRYRPKKRSDGVCPTRNRAFTE